MSKQLMTGSRDLHPTFWIWIGTKETICLFRCKRQTGRRRLIFSRENGRLADWRVSHSWREGRATKRKASKLPSGILIGFKSFFFRFGGRERGIYERILKQNNRGTENKGMNSEYTGIEVFESDSGRETLSLLSKAKIENLGSLRKKIQ